MSQIYHYPSDSIVSHQNFLSVSEVGAAVIMSPAVLTLLAICSLAHSLRISRTNTPRKVSRFATTQPLLDSDAVNDRIGSTAVADLFLDSLEEVITPRKLTPEGPGVPKWLTGTLLRNGPGLFSAQDPSTDDNSESIKPKKLRKFDHIFDGLAKITRYHFADDNSVDFSARFIDSAIFKVTTKKSSPIC